MQYLMVVRSLERQFKGFTLHHVDRSRNEEADVLAKATTRGETLPFDVFYHVIGTPAVRNPKGLQVTNDTEGHRIINLIMIKDWQAPITLFLQGYYHPSDVNEAKRLKHRSQDFVLVGGQVYKKGISQPMLKYVTKTEGIQILREVHSGTCGSHSVPRALAAKVICQGFYWPAIIYTANRVTRSCEACQKFSPRSSNPSQFTKLIAHTWPLQRSGLDIVGPLPTAQGTSGISAFPSAPSLPSPRYTTRNPTASSSAPTARFSPPSRKDFSTTRRVNGPTNYLKWSRP
jgi:hypothetical protein